MGDWLMMVCVAACGGVLDGEIVARFGLVNLGGVRRSYGALRLVWRLV